MTVHPYSRIFTGKTTAPTVNSDSSAGYEVGDIWIDETGDKSYQAVDVTVGAAVWSAGGTGDVVGPASAVNNDLAAFDTTTGKLIKDSGVLTSDAASAVSLKHTRSHAITGTSDHTSSATPGQILKADASGLPVDATNTDAAVAAAVTASHAAVTLDANADTVLSLTGQQIGLDTQTANKVFASATSGGAAVPAFRALVAADIPALTGAVGSVGTLDVILALTPTAGRIAYVTTVTATDTRTINKFMIADGTNWREVELPMSTRIGMDMGLEQDSGQNGYGVDYISDKRLANTLIGGNARTENGGVRIQVANDPDTLEIYLRGLWNTVLYDGTYVNGDYRHTPLNESIYVWRGDSVSVGINGRPIIQEYNVSMGAYPPARTINGGTF